MSKEHPTDDPRARNDKGSLKQTVKPWKGNPEKEQHSTLRDGDLERWHETDTN